MTVYYLNMVLNRRCVPNLTAAPAAQSWRAIATTRKALFVQVSGRLFDEFVDVVTSLRQSRLLHQSLRRPGERLIVDRREVVKEFFWKTSMQMGIGQSLVTKENFSDSARYVTRIMVHRGKVRDAFNPEVVAVIEHIVSREEFENGLKADDASARPVRLRVYYGQIGFDEVEYEEYFVSGFLHGTLGKAAKTISQVGARIGAN